MFNTSQLYQKRNAKNKHFFFFHCTDVRSTVVHLISIHDINTSRIFRRGGVQLCAQEIDFIFPIGPDISK